MGDRTRMERDVADVGDMEQTDHVEGTGAPGHGMTFTSAGVIPPVLAFPEGGTQAESASDIAFGVGRDGVKRKPSMPSNMNEGDLRARTEKSRAEQLLKSKSVTSPQDAVQALEILLTVDEKHQGKVIDELDDTAFENLIDRLPDEQRERLKMLVDASQNPKRKLRLWREQHMGSARHDLQRYEGNFGNEDERTGEQEEAKGRYDRRKTGVDTTQKEVDAETAKLLAKGDQLTVADIDKVRERKDKELEVEIKHNINLVTQDGPRRDLRHPENVDSKNPDVIWSTAEITHLDRALDKLPARHADDDNSVATYVRKSNDHFMDTRGGEYHAGTQSIDIFDHVHTELDDRNHVDPMEYSVVHEVGHEVETENRDAFRKFEKIASWQTQTEAQLEHQGFAEDDVDEAYKGVHAKDKVIHKERGKDLYYEVDDTALPSKDEIGNDRWEYASHNSHEHFAEMYAMAVETPDLLYTDYVQRPADNARKLRDLAREQASALDRADKASRPLLGAKLDKTKRELARAETIVKQRREMFDIIRNDIFRGNKGTAAAVARLKQKGTSTEAIRVFEEKAAHVSTPDQIAELEHEAMK